MHANIRNNEIIDFNSKYLDEDITRVETTQEMYELYKQDNRAVIYQDGEIVENPNYEEELKKSEREELDMLSLTAADVERAIYKDKGMDFEDVIEFVKDMPDIDVKALKIELKANNFYRGNPYVNAIGNILGYTSDDLDYLFVNKSLPDVNNSEDVEEKKPISEKNADDEVVNKGE